MKRTIAAIIAVSLVGYFAVRIPGTGYTLFELERSGRVPDGANGKTWRACESTFWWGKRLDPDAFWSNRVVWLDREVMKAAADHGRAIHRCPTSIRRRCKSNQPPSVIMSRASTSSFPVWRAPTGSGGFGTNFPKLIRVRRTTSTLSSFPRPRLPAGFFTRRKRTGIPDGNK